MTSINAMKKSPFEIEHYRTTLAKSGKFTELKATYNSNYPEIPDLNSARFWNEKFYTRKPLSVQDGMTRDRVHTASKFLPLQSLKNNRILDIGMGDGWVEERLEKKNVELYGNDISDQTIKHVKKRFKGHFTVQSLFHLNYGKLKFDTVFLLEVLEHVPPSKTLSVLADIRNLLSPQGYFILSVPTNEGLETMPDNPNGHVRLYTVPLITSELNIIGFKILKLKSLYAFNQNYIIKNLIAKVWKNRWKPNNIILLAQKT